MSTQQLSAVLDNVLIGIDESTNEYLTSILEDGDLSLAFIEENFNGYFLLLSKYGIPAWDVLNWT